MKHQLLLAFVFSVFVLSTISFAAMEFSIGVSPPVIELGDIDTGSTKIVNFYVVTPSSEPILIYLEPERGNLDFFHKDKYKDLVLNHSEEDVVPWIEILSNPVELKPVEGNIAMGDIKGWKEVNFLINVPKDAESGYHTVKINPIPSTPSENLGQAGSRVVAVTSVTILFNVPGDAERNGIILDVNTGNQVGNQLEINTYFQNTGTTTISAIAFNNIYLNGSSIENITSQKEFIKPGETKVLMSLLPLDKLAYGDYDITTTVDYTTGFASKNSTTTISSKYIITQPEIPHEFPWWIVIIIIILAISFCIYKWYK
jgi:hypothetical protein